MFVVPRGLVGQMAGFPATMAGVGEQVGTLGAQVGVGLGGVIAGLVLRSRWLKPVSR